ncbi:alpha/beta fold hydrolase [Azotobacter sp. CWF10]
MEPVARRGNPGHRRRVLRAGGTSLLAVRLINEITRAFGQTLPLVSLLRHGTIAAQAAMLDAAEHTGHQRTPLAVMREGGPATLALVHPVGGNILCYRELIELLPAGVSVLGLQSPGDGAPRQLEALAASYVDALCAQAAEPASIHLLGWSMGGVIAQEMARQMEARGIAPNGVTMIDSWMAAPQSQGGLRLEGRPCCSTSCATCCPARRCRSTSTACRGWARPSGRPPSCRR